MTAKGVHFGTGIRKPNYYCSGRKKLIRLTGGDINVTEEYYPEPDSAPSATLRTSALLVFSKQCAAAKRYNWL